MACKVMSNEQIPTFEDHLRNLDLQIENERIISNRMAEARRGRVLNIPPVERFVSADREILDASYQNELALNKLKQILKPHDAAIVLSNLRQREEVNDFNVHANGFYREIEGQKGITPLYFDILWERYLEKLLFTINRGRRTGIYFPYERAQRRGEDYSTIGSDESSEFFEDYSASEPSAPGPFEYPVSEVESNYAPVRYVPSRDSGTPEYNYLLDDLEGDIFGYPHLEGKSGSSGDMSVSFPSSKRSKKSKGRYSQSNYSTIYSPSESGSNLDYPSASSSSYDPEFEELIRPKLKRETSIPVESLQYPSDEKKLLKEEKRDPKSIDFDIHYYNKLFIENKNKYNRSLEDAMRLAAGTGSINTIISKEIPIYLGRDKTIPVIVKFKNGDSKRGYNFEKYEFRNPSDNSLENPLIVGITILLNYGEAYRYKDVSTIDEVVDYFKKHAAVGGKLSKKKSKKSKSKKPKSKKLSVKEKVIIAEIAAGNDNPLLKEELKSISTFKKSNRKKPYISLKVPKRIK